MSQENVEIVLRAIAAWNSGDDEAALRDADPEIVWQLSGAFPGFESEYHGHAGLRRFWKAFREPWECIAIEPLNITEVDQHRVLVNFRFDGTGRASGVDTTLEVSFLCAIRNGKVIRLRVFSDHAEALEAVGLRE
jgi:ketosteroid isomerase-like protein